MNDVNAAVTRLQLIDEYGTTNPNFMLELVELIVAIVEIRETGTNNPTPVYEAFDALVAKVLS